MITVGEYEQLNFITWQLSSDSQVTREEALSLYERNWRFVDEHLLTSKEKDLIKSLVETEGKGVFLG